jgi:tetratricopeptide (TPR) repeat protein
MKKEYQQVLDKAATCKLPNTKIKPIEAAAFKGLGDTAKAISAYESVIKERKDPMLVMQLAEMYYQKKMYNKATQLYSQLINEKADSLADDSLQLAVLLNNNAWTIMTAGTEDLSGALTMVKKAYEMASNNLNIIDTYASILLEIKKYKECIALLEGNSEAITQKRLLCHIAQAYKKLKNKNKARRYYEDALAAKTEAQKLSLLLSDEQIKNEIKRLAEE